MKGRPFVTIADLNWSVPLLAAKVPGTPLTAPQTNSSATINPPLQKACAPNIAKTAVPVELVTYKFPETVMLLPRPVRVSVEPTLTLPATTEPPEPMIKRFDDT